MSILDGFIKARSRKKTDEGFIWESRDTHSDTVFMPDGNTATNNLGAIKGITTSTSVTEEGYAADASAFNEFRNEVNQSLTLDYSNAREDVQNINTLLQNLLDKFYPKIFSFIKTKGQVHGTCFYQRTRYHFPVGKRSCRQ